MPTNPTAAPPHPEDIKAALRKRGHTLTSIAAQVRGRYGHAPTKGAVSRVLHGKLQSAAIASAIEAAAGLPAGSLGGSPPPGPRAGEADPDTLWAIHRAAKLRRRLVDGISAQVEAQLAPVQVATYWFAMLFHARDQLRRMGGHTHGAGFVTSPPIPACAPPHGMPARPAGAARPRQAGGR